MADSDIQSGLKSLKNSKILVNVDEVLQDILVVTYAFESKLFQGVLLDSTKRQLPCGIIGPPNFLNQMVSPKTDNNDDDKLYSVSQRFTYFQEKNQVGGGKGGLLNHFHVRRAIKPPARFKGARMTVRLRPRQVLCSKCRSICNENSENVDHSSGRKKTPPFSENQCSNLDSRDNRPSEHGPSLIPKISRLRPNEINNAINGKVPVSVVNKSPLDLNYWIHSNNSPTSNISDGVRVEEDSEGKMVLRKKRSVGSMEDLWDESVFEEKRARTTPVIKISFGSQGEGEVLKIPSKLKNCSESEAEDKQKAASVKAAKRALKKAKKEARRKMSGPSTPGASPVYEALHYRRHRHKVKHKKKHKEERAKDDVDIKEQCLKQKLSISLRRLNATAYARREESGSSPATSHSSEEALPDFPPSPTPLDPLNMDSKVTSIHTSEGRLLAVGDIVWGKIHGFPWWPGKVLSISVKEEGRGTQAHVAWYGSSTSSLMPCDQLSPFLETFKSRFNKKKKSGQYKEAIRQATTEASGLQSQPAPVPSEPLPALPLITASPTQVHVVS